MDRGYRVEWTTDVPTDECGDAILDAGKQHARIFAEEHHARHFAAQVAPHDFFGCVQVTPVQKTWDADLERHTWQDVGETFVIEPH